VSERGLPIADGAPACPFVAFEDDRDERATVPDHRHRCYADLRPTPRALAHQEAYCLSSAFPVCPTFQDWARREAARARADAKAREDADVADRAAATAGAVAAGGAAAAAVTPTDGLAAAGDDVTDDAGTSDRDVAIGEPAGDLELVSAANHHDDDDRSHANESDDGREDGPDDDDEPRRNPPREWSAPPPWLASSEGARNTARNAPPPNFLARRAGEPGAGLAGSAADRLAGGPIPPSVSAEGRSTPARRLGEHEPDIEEIDDHGAPPARRPRAYDQHLGGPSSGPDWEQPRRYEAYPTIRTRVGMPEIPRIVVLAGLVALAALALFFLPAILGLGRNGAPSGGSPLPSAAAPSVSFEPTPAPAATPIVYSIKKGENLSKIATAHGITLAQLLAANPTIKNPNKITEGQQIIIPTPEPDVPSDVGASDSPATSP
jgi:LysM repeat protein